MKPEIEILSYINRIDLEVFAELRIKLSDVVRYGPFSGTRIVDEFSWGDCCLKLLGLYEHYLHDAIRSAFKRPVDCVVNVGCAEGYYAVGLARLAEGVPVFAFDISEESQRICAKMAALNNVSDRVLVGGLLTPRVFQQLLEVYDSPLVVMDIEGGEFELLDLTLAPALARAEIICECHEWMLPGGIDVLKGRFSHSHICKVIDEVDLRGTDVAEIAHLSGQVRASITCEKRGTRMRWLHMTPKEPRVD